MAALLKSPNAPKNAIDHGRTTMSYFKPFRRKFGILTLVMACVFMVGWVRSLNCEDEITVIFSKTNWASLQTEPNRIFYVAGHCEEIRSFISRLPFHRSKHPSSRRSVFDSDQIDWLFRWPGLGFGQFDMNGFAIGNVKHAIFRSLWYVSYPSIVIPLTLLSAWMLFNKPRHKPAKVTT